MLKVPTHAGHSFSTTTAGVIGNVMEWCDFALYGSFTPILAQLFEPLRQAGRCRAVTRSGNSGEAGQQWQHASPPPEPSSWIGGQGTDP